MDYQYKSVLRGENSIFEQVRAQGVDPTGMELYPFLASILLTRTEHIFFFNLHSYDRINKTKELVEQEEKSGVHYQDVQRAMQEQIMGESVHPDVGEEGDLHEHNYHISKKEQENKIDSVRRFEEQREQAYDGDREIKSSDSIA